MTHDQAFQTLRSFLTQRQAPRRALSKLREGVEIGVVIGETVECSVFRQSNEIVVEKRAAHNPDFVFVVGPETVVVLAERVSDDIGEIGIEVFKEMLAGAITVRMPGGLFSFLTHGYLEVVASGGAPVAQYLANHGLGSVPKVLRFLKRWRP